MVIKGYRVETLLKKVGREIMDDGIPGLAAQTAYYFFFSLFPLFLFAAPILSLLGNEQQIIQWIMGQLSATVPTEALDIVRNVVREVVFSENAPGLMSIGALLAAWAGSNVFDALRDSLNRAYDVTETRPWWKRKLTSLAMVLGTGLLMATAATVMLAGPEIVDTVAAAVRMGVVSKWLWMILQYPLALAFLIGAMWLIYFVLPNERQHKRQIVVGATVATVLWIVVTLGFRLYVSNFGSYNKTYGTIGAVIILLTWMYLTMLVILAGGELNAELLAGTGAVEPRKGTVYEGRIVTALEPDRPSTARVEQATPLSAKRS